MQELFPLVELMGNTVSVPCTCGFICVDSDVRECFEKGLPFSFNVSLVA